MFSGLADDEEEGMLFGDEQSMHYIKRLIILAKRWWKKHQPFGRDLLMVESRYGNSVASYFIFFRWLFINAMILAVLQSLFLTSHIYSIYSSGLPYQQNGTLNATYVPRSSWLKVTGTVPDWSLYSSYSTNEAIQYAFAEYDRRSN